MDIQQEALNKINAHLKKKRELGNYKLPLVSVIVTNYNYSQYLEECLDSILNQDYPFIQRIVVDDCSTDNSKEILKNYEDKFEIIYKDKNEGQLAAFFDGLEVAKGDFIVFVDADDVLDKEVVSAHLSLHLFKTPQVAFTCVRNRQISKNSTLLSDYHLDFNSDGKKYKLIKPRVIHQSFWLWSTTSAMMFRKDVLDLIKTDNTEPFRICADYYIVHFSNLLGGSYLYNKALVNYRRHGDNGFSKNKIIGGKKPTGHLKIHNHPEHIALQKEIINKLLKDREIFETYFPDTRSYAKLIAKVMYVDDILKDKDIKIDTELKILLQCVKGEVAGERQEMLKQLAKKEKKNNKKIKW